MNPSKLTILREEAKRKTIHTCGVAIPVFYFFFPKHLVVLGFVFSSFVIFVLEWLRFRGVISLPFLRQSEKEKKKIGAYVFFVIGAFISILIFAIYYPSLRNLSWSFKKCLSSIFTKKAGSPRVMLIPPSLPIFL